MNVLNVKKIVSQIFGEQNKVYPADTATLDIPEDMYMNEFSHSENSVRVIFDHAKNKVLYISDNAESIGGYSTDDYYKLGLFFILKLFTFEHYDFAHRWWQWSYDTNLTHQMGLKPKQAMCGVKFVHNNGSTIRVLFRQVALKKDQNGIISVSAFTLDDVTHLLKADFYWGRIDTDNPKNQFHHLISTDKQYKPTDILSDREKETLRLLAQGKESKEIGQLLFISSHTVDNHRRNMIAKIGVRDTTGLVQICRMVSIT